MIVSSHSEYPLGEVSPEDTKIELSCGCTEMALIFLVDEYGEEVADELAYSTRMNRSYLANSRNWVSLDYYFRFLRRMVELTGDPDAAFRSGLYAIRDDCFGPFGTLLIRLGTVASTYALQARLNHLFNRISVWQHKSTGKNSCTMTVRYPNHKQDRNNCLALQGATAALPELHGCPRATIRHTQCACDGHPACVYEISWIEKPAQIRALVGAFAGAGIGLIMALLNGFAAPFALAGLIMTLIGYLGGRISDYSIRLKESYVYSKKQSDSLEASMKETELLNQELQQIVEERTEALQKANKELIEKRKNELAQQRAVTIGTLASGMAHELNTPLNTIQLGVQGLLRNPSKMGDDAELVSSILRAAMRCSRIVGDLLTFSREPQTVSLMRLHEVVEGSLAVFENEKPEGIRIVREITHPPPISTVDGAQIQQVLLNLLSNAVDAMEREGVITVRLRSDEANAIVDIADRGPGIPQDRLKRVFEPFESTKRSTGKGLGLGLSIATELVAKNKGTIDVTSQVGQGACFTIRFPLVSPEPASGGVGLGRTFPSVASMRGDCLTEPSRAESTVKAVPSPSVSDDGIDLLLVEDDRDAGQTLKRMLEWHDVRVVHVTSGKQGIAAFDSEGFDAVVTDVFLGDMTGMDVLRAIREKDEQFPVIMLTGHDSIGSAVDSLRLGAQDYIRKPLERIEDIINPVKKAVYHHNLQRETKALNAELRVSEARFRSLAELLPETVFEVNNTGRITFLNRSGMTQFGLTDESLQKGFFLPQGVSPDDSERAKSALARVLAGETVSGVEFVGLSQSGKTFPILTSATPIHDGERISGARAIVIDVSRQKAAEEELIRYQRILVDMDSKLQVTEERERCKLAQDLHDSVAQLLVAARIRISLCSRCRNDTDLPVHLASAHEIVSEALKQTRSLVFQLSPPSLYTQGIQAGLEDLAGYMLPTHGLNVTFNKCDDPVCLDEAARVNVFRAVRELLINAAKHSGAKECVVTVSQKLDKVYVIVEDQGTGFDVSMKTQTDAGGGFGLFSARERLKSINGSLVVESAPGKGTVATVCVPISTE
jgi:PAS domain S-box-containing protein